MASKSEVCYKSYAKGGIGFLLPSFLEVESDIPHFYAKSREQNASVVIEIDSDPMVRAGWERLLREPLRTIPELQSRMIRQGRIETPFQGWEKIIEHRLKADGTVDFAWLLILYVGEEFMQVQLGEFREFSIEREQLWQKMIDSFRQVPDV
jgi:hypothetical protein